MKKFILSLIPVLCAAFVLTACKDDNKTEVNHSVPLEKAVGSYTGNNLAISVGGQSAMVLAGETAEISGKDANNLTISVPDYAIPGETGLKFTGVKMTTPMFNAFEGKDSTASRVIKLNGELRDGRLALNLTTKYKSDAVGIWNLNMETDEDGVATLTPISINTELSEELGMSNFIIQLVGSMLKGSMALVNINFQEDGNLTATYNANTLNDLMVALSGDTIHPVFVKTPVNAMRWYTKDNMIYLVPNLNLMFKNNPTKAGLGSIVNEGIPMYFKKEGDKMTVYADKAQCAPVLGVLSSVITMIDPEYELVIGEGDEAMTIQLRTMLDMMVKPVCDVAAKAEQFDFCINLIAGEIPEEAPKPASEASAAVVKDLKAFAGQK